MSPWKHALLGLYYYGTLPYRACVRAGWARNGDAPIMILFYHRVADTHPNDWTTSNRRFAQQMAWLQRHFDVISLPEVQRRLRTGRNSVPSVSITFDDGYAENCDQALPLLLRLEIPYTYFVSSRHVLEGVPFPHDVHSGTPLAPNTLRQLRDLSAAGVEIGAHTRTHADLGQVTRASVLEEEVIGSKHDLEQALGRPVRYFAFPFGQRHNITREAMRLARKAGYDGACSAFGGYNVFGDDAFHLLRFHGDPIMLRLKNWLTVDPRHASGSVAFPPRLGPASEPTVAEGAP